MTDILSLEPDFYNYTKNTLCLWQFCNMAKSLNLSNQFRVVISELKYDDSDILLLDDDSIAKFQTSYGHGALSPLTSLYESSNY